MGTAATLLLALITDPTIDADILQVVYYLLGQFMETGQKPSEDEIQALNDLHQQRITEREAINQQLKP